MAAGSQLTVLGNITGGTAPFTYQWSIKSLVSAVPLGLNNTTPATINAGATTHTVTLEAPDPGEVTTGLACCKVTDATGLVTYAYYWVWQAVEV